MTRGLWMLSTVALLTACGGSGADQLCKDSAAARCSKLFECYTSDPERMALMLGTSAAQCTTTLQARCEPTTDGGVSDAQCAKPKLYDTEAASQCISEFKRLTCTTVKMGSFPSSCSNVCK